MVSLHCFAPVSGLAFRSLRSLLLPSSRGSPLPCGLAPLALVSLDVWDAVLPAPAVARSSHILGAYARPFICVWGTEGARFTQPAPCGRSYCVRLPSTSPPTHFRGLHPLRSFLAYPRSDQIKFSSQIKNSNILNGR